MRIKLYQDLPEGGLSEWIRSASFGGCLEEEEE